MWLHYYSTYASRSLIVFGQRLGLTSFNDRKEIVIITKDNDTLFVTWNGVKDNDELGWGKHDINP